MSSPESDDRAAVVQYLEGLRAAGIRQLPRPTRIPARQAALSQGIASPNSHSGKETRNMESGSVESPEAATAAGGEDSGASAATLEILQQHVAACTKCPDLVANRTQTVFGVGNPAARLCFLGEGPGADEDRQGIPFVGRAGKLLTDIITKGMKIGRDDVYILNVVKCRPPQNRTPTSEEAHHCRPFLLRQLELIRPEFICCLGACASQNLLETTTPIGKLRGRVHACGAYQVVCTYHPAYLLRNPPAKKYTWDDIRLLMDAMGMSAG